MKGVRTVCCDPSEAQLEGLTSSYSRDWNPLPRGTRPARTSAALSVFAQEVEAARNKPRRELQHIPSSELTVR